MPDIFLSGGYTYLNPNPYKGFEKKFGGDWNIGVVLSMPIFHWGDRVHTLNAAKRIVKPCNMSWMKQEN